MNSRGDDRTRLFAARFSIQVLERDRRGKFKFVSRPGESGGGNGAIRNCEKEKLTLLSEEHGEDEEQRKIHRRSLVDDRGSGTSTFAYPG